MLLWGDRGQETDQLWGRKGLKKKSSFKVYPKPELKRVWGGEKEHAPLREALARAPPYAELSPNPRPGWNPVTAREPVWRKVDREPASWVSRGRWNLAARGENVSLAAAATVLWSDFLGLPGGRGVPLASPHPLSPSLSLRGSYTRRAVATKATPPS